MARPMDLRTASHDELRMPGNIFEHIAFVNLHRIGDLAPGWFSCRTSNCVDYASNQLDVAIRERSGKRTLQIVIRSIAFAANILQPMSGDLSAWISRIGKTQPKIAVGAIAARHRESEIEHQIARNMKCSVVGSTYSGSPLRLRAPCQEGISKSQEFEPRYHSLISNARTKVQTCGAGHTSNSPSLH
jgi:hypothetical protein